MRVVQDCASFGTSNRDFTRFCALGKQSWLFDKHGSTTTFRSIPGN
jgi:hypothetical protein